MVIKKILFLGEKNSATLKIGSIDSWGSQNFKVFESWAGTEFPSGKNVSEKIKSLESTTEKVIFEDHFFPSSSTRNDKLGIPWRVSF